MPRGPIHPNSAIRIAQDEARKLSVELSDEDADYMVWEHTGFPSFWDDKPETCIRRDIRAVLSVEPPPDPCWYE